MNKYELKYPFTIVPREAYRYIQRPVPIICFFENQQDLTSWNIVLRIKNTCTEFPKVFCYKIGWHSYIKNCKKKFTENLYEVAIWKRGIKEMHFVNPTTEELREMFSYINSRINGKDELIYLSCLEKEQYLQEKYEKQKRRMNNRYMKRQPQKEKCFNPFLQNSIINLSKDKNSLNGSNNNPQFLTQQNSITLSNSINSSQIYLNKESKSVDKLHKFSLNQILNHEQNRNSMEVTEHTKHTSFANSQLINKCMLNEYYIQVNCPTQNNVQKHHRERKTFEHVIDTNNYSLKSMASQIVPVIDKLEIREKPQEIQKNISISGASKRKSKHPRKIA